MLSLEYCEFYITNVCNLNCPRCNRFNNYAFGGHQRWADYADIYRSWSQRLDIKRIGILGGEPMLNPDFDQWIQGITDLWPRSQIVIMTNGTQFKRWPNLYQFLLRYRARIRIDVNRHNKTSEQDTLASIEAFYPGPYKKYYINSGYFTQSPDHDKQFEFKTNKVGSEIWHDPTFDIAYKDSMGMFVRYATSDYFDNICIEFDPELNCLKLPHMNNPQRAVEVCSSKWSHHLMKGLLYKCNVSAVLPEFVKQFPVSMTEDQRALIQSYQPADISFTNEELVKFIDNLQNGHSIDQCQLCPVNFNSEQFAAGHKKIPIKILPEDINKTRNKNLEVDNNH